MAMSPRVVRARAKRTRSQSAYSTRPPRLTLHTYGVNLREQYWCVVTNACGATSSLAIEVERKTADLVGPGRQNYPDGVFDTDLWTPEALATSARRYGLTVEQYKARNLMRTEVTSKDVARAVVALADSTFSRTTGAQIPVDGGNDRVI